MEIQKAEEKNLSVRIKDKSIASKEFKVVIQTICFDIGIRQALDPTDLDSIFNFIKRNFGLLTLENIREAFDLFSASKLHFKTPTFNHYNSFDNTFIGTVLSSYNSFKMDINRNKPKTIKKEPEKKPFTYQEAKTHTELIQQKYIDKESLKEANWFEIYLYLRKEGLINFTPEQIKSPSG